MNGESLPFFDRLFREMAHSGWEDWAVKLLALVLVGLIGAGATKLGRRIWPKLTSLWSASQKIRHALAAVGPESKGLWIAEGRPIGTPLNYKNCIRVSKPIIVVANLKGGVGKTTIAANLIAHYANTKKERVLGIDLDFQGSLTACGLSEANRNSLLTAQSDGGLSKSARLIDDRDAAWLHDAPDAIENVPTGKLIPAYYSLAAMENRVMVEWLLSKRTNDVRYQLANVLHDPVIQSTYDRIIIDAPPRLTTACVQALCAATHVLIPTVLDDLSTEAVGAFADQLRIHQALWPNLKIVGVVGTMTDKSPLDEGKLREQPLSDVEVDALAAGRAALTAALQTASAPLRDATFMPIKCFIPDKLELGRAAGHRIVYASTSQAAPFKVIREAFDQLGNEIDRRLSS